MSVGKKRLLALLVVLALLGAAAVTVIWVRTSAAGRYDRVREGMTLADVEGAVGRTGEEKAPADTTGVFRFDRETKYPGAGVETARRHWGFSDGLMTCTFGADGRIASKVLLLR